MSSTPSPEFERLSSGRENSDPSISVGSISVGGNVDGNIIAGNRNVIGDKNVIYEVNTLHGDIVHHYAPPPISRRKINQPLPRNPRGFVGREYELKALEQHIRNKEPVLVYGHDGIGKTALVKKAANSDAAQTMSDGVFYIEQIYEGSVMGLQDILQRLFDKLFESNPQTKVTDSIVEAHLGTTSPLGILDDPELPASSLNKLLDLLPMGAFVVTSQNVSFDDTFESIQLMPLAHEDAIQLFAQKSGAVLDASTRQLMDQICKLLEDIPLAITNIANALSQKRLQLLTVAESLAAIQPPSQNSIQAAIERSFGLIYSALNKEERDMLAITAAAPGNSVDRLWLESLAGGEKISHALESLELLTANSPRLRLPEGMRQVLQFGGRDSQVLRERQLRHLLGELKSRSLDFNFVADELGNILGLLQWASNERRWADVIALGRAVDPYLTLHGLWDAWETVLKQILVAGQNLKDLAVQGWAYHQLGTREIGVGSLKQAVYLLVRALRIRESQGDMVGRAYTLHNLNIILPPETKDESERQYESTRQTDIPLWKEIWKRRRDDRWIIPILLLGIAVIIAILLWPSLSLNKEARPVRYNDIGQVIEYSYIIDNSLFVPLEGPISVTDDKFMNDDEAKVFCPDIEAIGNGDGFLNWNETMICNAFYTITDADVQNGSVTNTATANARAGDNLIQSQPKSVTINFDPKYLTLTKSADTKTYSKAGEIITYVYKVKNAGEEALPGPVSVTDSIMDKPIQVPCPQVNMVGNQDDMFDPDEALTCTATYTITEDDVKNCSVTNTAIASAGDINSDPQSVTIYFYCTDPNPDPDPDLPDLILTKLADRETYQGVGDEVSYTYVVTNQGTESLNGPVTVTDSVMDKPIQVPCPQVNTVGNQDNTFDPNESLTCVAPYTITLADVENGLVTNMAIASAGDINSDPQSVTIYFKALPPTLTKSANRETYESVGDKVLYTYVVTNEGKGPLNGPVTVTDTVRDEQRQVPCPDVDTIGNRDGFLDPDEPLTCTATYTITAADVRNRSVTNTAIASAGDINSDPQSVTIYWKRKPKPTLRLTKSADSETYRAVGEEITYTYFITPEYNVPVRGPVAVEDDKIPANQISCPAVNTVGNQNDYLDLEEILTCTGIYKITEDDIENGSVTNIAEARAGDFISNKDSVTINEKALALNKSADPKTYEKVDQPIKYTYDITGMSKFPLKGRVIIMDDKIPVDQIDCPRFNTTGNLDGYLDWDETITCTATYFIIQADIDNGSVTNTARARVSDVISEPDTDTITGPVQVSGLLLNKTANPTTYDSENQQITYKYEIKNSGNVTLSPPFKITDDHIENGTPFICETDNQTLAPGELVTCTGTYNITRADFETKSVTNTAIASVVYFGKVITSTATATITCPTPRTGWVIYIVQDETDLQDIARWYSDTSVAEFQAANCMGSLTNIFRGQTLYIPPPPPARISGFIWDTQIGRTLQISVILTNANGIIIKGPITSGANGYEFSDLEYGVYRIFQVEITLSPGEQHPQDFIIIPRPP